MIQFKKYFLRVCTILFILASALPVNWSMDISQAIAARVNPDAHPPLNFNQHYTYNRHLPDSPFRTSWELDVDFPKGKMRAKWIFRIEQKASNLLAKQEAWVLTDEYIQNIQCIKHGDVQILNGKAKFSSNTQDYITCETPNYIEVAERMSEILGLNVSVSGRDDPRICTGCIDPWINAAIKIQRPQENVYPIVYMISEGREKLKFESQIGSHPVPRLETNMTNWDYMEKSQSFTLQGSHNVWTGVNVQRFLDTLKTRNQGPYGTPWTQYWSSIQSLPNDVDSIDIKDHQWLSWVEDAQGLQSVSDPQEYNISNGVQMIYIGYNPETDAYFNGTMYNVGVDPGCIGF